MERNNDNLKQSQQGTGSAENRGQDREQQQQQQNVSIDGDQRENLAEEAGLRSSDLADLNDLGQASGRDDYAGGDNDGMSEGSTGEPTDR